MAHFESKIVNHASREILCLKGYILDDVKFHCYLVCKDDASIISLNLKSKFFVEKTFVSRLHYISPSNLRSLLLLLSLQLRDLCPYASEQGLIRPSPPRSRRDQSDRYFLNMVNPRAYL